MLYKLFSNWLALLADNSTQDAHFCVDNVDDVTLASDNRFKIENSLWSYFVRFSPQIGFYKFDI